MTRLGFALFAFVLSAPLAAHEGLTLDSSMHRFLHYFGTDNVFGVSGIVLIIGAGVLFRRRLRARSTKQTDLAR